MQGSLAYQQTRKNGRACERAAGGRPGDCQPRRHSPSDAAVVPDGECFITSCFARRVKIRNTKENPSVMLVIVRKNAELVEDNVPMATLENAMRYEGEEQEVGRGAYGRRAPLHYRDQVPPDNLRRMTIPAIITR